MTSRQTAPNLTGASILTKPSTPSGILLFGLLLAQFAGAAPAVWPSGRLQPADARQVDAKQFLPASQLRDWQVDLDHRGLRATGSPAHEGYIDELARLLRVAGVKDVRFEALPMRRWTAQRWSLDILGGG